MANGNSDLWAGNTMQPTSSVGAGAGTAAPLPQQQTGSSGLAGLLGINDQQLLQLQKALQATGSSFNTPGASSNYMRAGMPAQLAQGQPNNLLTTILQMRNNQSAAMGAPYQTGVAAPQMSLLR